MTKNPFVNAFCAIAYIVLVGVVMNFVSQTQSNKPDTAFAPIAFLSLLTLSAALMGSFFLYQPVQFFLDGKKKEATKLLLQTILVFAAITAVIFTLFLTGILH